jgi:hypothetical protein
MHCPRCGTNAAVDQQFCRSCGLNLERVAEVLGEELLTPNSETTNNLARLRERQQKLELWGGIAAMSTLGLVFLTLVIAIVRGMIMGTTPLLAGILFIVLVVIASVMAWLLSSAQLLKNKLAPLPLTASNQIKTRDTQQLYPYREPLESITDRTTELLTASKKPTSKSDD